MAPGLETRRRGVSVRVVRCDRERRRVFSVRLHAARLAVGLIAKRPRTTFGTVWTLHVILQI